MKTFKSAYTSDAPFKEFLRLLKNADEAEFKKALKRENLSEEFIHTAFFCAEKISDDTRVALAQHFNAPASVLLMCLRFYPEWVEESPAIARIQLEKMDGKGLSWEKMVENFMAKTRYGHLISSLWVHWKRFVKQEYDWLLISSEGHSIVIKSLARRHIEAVLDSEDFRDIEVVAGDIVKSKHDLFVNNSNYRIRLLAAKKIEELSDSNLVILAQDSTASIRKVIASKPKLSDKVIDALIGMNDSTVNAVLAKRKTLKKKHLAALHVTTSEIVGLEDVSINAISGALVVLRDQRISEDLLLAHAKHKSPVIRCVAAMHPCAGNKVLCQIEKDEVEWVKGALAARTKNAVLMAKLAKSEHKDVIQNLANNPSLPLDLAIKLLKTHNDDQVRQGLASSHCHNAKFMKAFQASSDGSEEWENILVRAVNRKTSKQELSKIHNDKIINQLSISKALARHEKCPEKYLDILAYYLPEDAKANPVNAKAVAAGKKIKATAYSDWSTERRMREKVSKAFFAHPICKGSDNELLRLAAQCMNSHYVFMDYVALNDDDRIQKYLADRPENSVSQFVLELLSCSKRAPVRKLLLGRSDLPDSIVERLSEDKDQSVRQAVTRLKKPNRPSSNAKKAGNKTKSSTSEQAASLGNKAARIDLAYYTEDLSIVQRLVEDKLADVRRATLERSDLSHEMLLLLTNDDDMDIVEQAIEQLNEQDLPKKLDEKYQERLQALLQNDKSPSSLRQLCIYGITDYDFVDRLALDGKLGENISDIAESTTSKKLIEQLVFDLKRNKGTLRYSRELLGNPLLTEKQIVAVQSSEGYKTNYVISCIRNGKVLVKLIKQLDHDDQFENHCNWPFKADLSKSQILEILEVDKRYVVCMPELVNKIAQSKIKACLKPLNDSLRISMCGNSGWPEPILEWLFDWAIALEDAEMSDKALSDIAIHQNVTKTHVKHYLNHKNPEVRMWLAASRVDAVDSDVLFALANDESKQVRDYVLACLCEREMDNIASLQLLAHDTVHDIRMEAREVLKEWEIDLKPKAEVMKTRKPKSKNTQKKASQKNKRTRAITYLLKSHDAPFGAVKANKKLIELGLIEECERESTTKPGAMRKYKQLTKAGLAYGVNKFNPFGDANIEFYEDDFPELLKKIA